MKTQVDSLKLVLAFILVMNALWVAPVGTAVAQESDKPEAIRRSAGMSSLPDPLVSAAGVKVTTARQWQDQRRAEVLELFREHVYGRSPGRPEGLSFKVVEEDPLALKGTATRREVDIAFPGPRGTFTFRLVIYLPNPAKKPVPVFLLLNHRCNVSGQVNNPFFPVDQIIARGYAAAGITLSQLSPDKADTYRDGVLGFIDGPEERSPDAWRTIAAWAWGGSRAMDYFETDKQIDSKRVAVLGHSRGGKTALWCGAEDERFALTISNDSGETGAALARRGVGQSLAIGNIRNPHWFTTNFKRYNDKEDKLPVDQHELIALLAPRLAYVASAETDSWADPLGEFLSCVHATPVYRLFGLKGMETDQPPPLDQPIHDGRIGYHIRKGGHGLTEYDWQRFMDFADRRLGQGPDARPAPKDQREQEGTPKTNRKPATYSFPPVNSLPDLATMPDPFRKPDGTRVATQAEWPEQRAYLKALLEHYLYGTIPPRPTGKELSFERISDEAYSPPDSTIAGRKQSYRITITRGGKQHAFTFNLWRPAAERRYPTLINNQPEHSQAAREFSMAEGLRRGYAVVEFRRGEIAPDQADNANRKRGIFPLYPEYDFATIAAWGWAYQPVIDTLDRLGVVAMDKIVATGHSRGGQTAMAGAIFDERIAIAAPSTGGPFSVGSTRQRDPEGYRGKMDYPANFLKAQPHWFHPRYFEFVGKQNQQPWDATTLAALVAPRPLLHVNAVADGINNGLAHEAGIRAAQVIYGWWGAEQFPRLHWRDVENKFGQKGHDQGPEEFLAIFDFADEFFFGKPLGPSTYNAAPKSDTWRYDPAKFPLLIGWKIPATR